MKQLLLIAIFVTSLAPAIPAQPATAPTTLPARHQVIIPPGFIKIETSERTALCEPKDKEWITKALNDFQPGDRPTTMPSDLADALTSKREDIIKQMTADLGLTDTASAHKLFTEQVGPDLNKMADLRPPMFYLVCTKSKLLDLIHSGWSDPRFHYNRMADDVTVYQDVDLSIQHSMDDLLIPAIYDDTKDVPARTANFQKQVDINEANIAGSLAMQGLIMLQSGLVAAIDDAAIKPLTLKPGEEWFGVGIEGALSTRYMAQLNGMRYQDLLAILTDDEPGTPFRAASVDLMHPMDLKQLRAEFAPAYVDAVRRRSVIVINNLMLRTGPDALPKLLAAVKSAQPADSAALLDLIKQTLGIDLSHDVASQ